MKYLLNISTEASDLDIAGEDWSAVVALLEEERFDGVEVYPTPGYDLTKIPASIVTGLHLRFFVIIEPIWHGDRRRLLEIFGNEDTVRHFYGGTDRQALIDAYREQLRVAAEFGCEYVVFHAAQCELEYIFDWQFPWTWQHSIDLCAELINEVMRDTDYQGKLLFENLWWPGSFRLDGPEEIERLLGAVRYPNSGVVLDTGHILNKNQAIQGEADAIAYLLDAVKSLGTAASTIQAVHLTRSLSADYVIMSRQLQNAYAGAETFWDRFEIARRHVEQIDTHDAFESPAIAALFEFIAPEHVVFEFAFKSLAEWRRMVRTQCNALFHGLPHKNGIDPTGRRVPPRSARCVGRPR